MITKTVIVIVTEAKSNKTPKGNQKNTQNNELLVRLIHLQKTELQGVVLSGELAATVHVHGLVDGLGACAAVAKAFWSQKGKQHGLKGSRKGVLAR